MVDYSIDFYEIIGAKENESRANLRGKVEKAVLKYDVEVRTTIPQRIQGEAKEKLRKKLGREPKKHEEDQYLQERTQSPDTKKRDPEYVEKTIKLRLAIEARQILISSTNKKQYDDFHNKARQAKCHDHNTGKWGGRVEAKFFSRDDPQSRKWNSHYFCSSFCLNEFLKQFKREEEPDTPPNNNKPQCIKCNRNDKPHYHKRKDGKIYCSECYEKVKNPGNENTQKPHPEGGKCRGGYCNGNKYSTEWKKWGTRNKYYCKFCYNALEKERREREGDTPPRTPPQNPLQEAINSAIAEIQDALDKEPPVLLSELSSDYRNYMSFFKTCTSPWQIIQIKPFKDRMIAEIKVKRETKKNEDDGRDRDPLKDYKYKASAAIEKALKTEPETQLEELESENQNYLEKISQANDKDQIDAIASQVLKNIQQIRDSKTKDQDPAILLEDLKTETINLINQELKRKPELSQSDISYPNWEKELEEATEESQIIKIRQSIFTEIKNKRAAQQEEIKIIELISQGQKATTFEAISQIITQLKNFSSTDAYQKHQGEIEALESRLQTIDSTKYEEQVDTDLQNQMVNNGVTENQLSEETKKARAKAKETKSLADKKLAENLTNRDIAQVKLDGLLQKALTILSNDKASKIEKEQLAAEIKEFISKDGFKKTAYQKIAPQVNQLLNQLLGEQQEQTPTSPKPTWPKALGIGALIVIPVVLIIGIIFSQRGMKRRWRR